MPKPEISQSNYTGVILKSSWTRLKRQLSLIKYCLGFRCHRDPSWPRIHLWLQLGSGSPPLFLLQKFSCLQPVCWSAGILSPPPPPERGAGRSGHIKYTNTLCSLAAPEASAAAHQQRNPSKGCPKGWGKAESSSSSSK